MSQCGTGQPSSGAQPRVLLWAVPRSVSTALFRAIIANKAIKPLLEEYSKAFYVGTERVSDRYSDSATVENATFRDIKLNYEKPYPEYEAVFAKDMAYYIRDKLEDDSLIPAGYTHTILIRQPSKALASLYRMSTNEEKTGWTKFDGREAGFVELEQLYRLLTEKLGHKVLVIDADDILADPERMLREYCRRTGLCYVPEMIEWESSGVDLSVFQDWLPWFEAALTAPAFQRSPNGSQAIKALPEEVHKAIELSLPSYNFLYDKRLKLEACPMTGSSAVLRADL